MSAACREMQPVAAVAEGVGLAHDARNLFGALSLYTELLAQPGVLHEEHREYAAELRLLSERSWAMIDRLVNHAQGTQASRVTAEATVVPEVVERCRGLLGKVAGQAVEFSYGEGAHQPVSVPAEAVERILMNLVKNAAEAAPWVGTILVTVERLTDRAKGVEGEVRQRIVMTVKDRGCGMDAAAVRRLMQVGGISSAGGRGIGFRVVRELVAISGGCLTVESQPEIGTSISVEWYALRGGEAAAGVGGGPELVESGASAEAEGFAGWVAC